MREESHLDDMRVAIRGDFERLERRLGVQELMSVRMPEPESEPCASPVLAAEPFEAAHAELEEAVEPPAPAPRSWLARLLAAIQPRQV